MIASSVKSSNAIEGIVTSDKRIAAIVNQDSEPLNHNEREIAGYKDALKEIHEGSGQIPLSKEAILHLHKVIYSHTGLEYGGEYKKTNNLILEYGPGGERGVRFIPVKASDTEKAME